MSAQRRHVRRERWSVVDPGRLEGIAAYAVIWALLALLAIALVQQAAHQSAGQRCAYRAPNHSGVMECFTGHPYRGWLPTDTTHGEDIKL